jgi:thioesterase domain-containing protein
MEEIKRFLPILLNGNEKLNRNIIIEMFEKNTDFNKFFERVTDYTIGGKISRIDRLRHAARLMPVLGIENVEIEAINVDLIEFSLRNIYSNMLLVQERIMQASNIFTKPAVLIRGLETRELSDSSTMEWDNYCTKLNVIDVDSYHANLIGKEGATVVGKEIVKWLEIIKRSWS